MGRPSDFTQEIADIICERLANGESLRRVCRDDDMPNASTVHLWVIKNEAFSKQYARAREVQADKLFEEVLEIADTPAQGERRKLLPNGSEEITTGDMIEHRRLQVDARKWMAGKLAPKKYGDKVTQEHVGADGGPLRVVISPTDAGL